MNIFFLDRDPEEAARLLVDKHCVKMILETCQLLSTAHRVLDGELTIGKSKTGRKAKRWVLHDAREEVLYKATHVNHPCAVWCRESLENYNWLVEHMIALCKEYHHRYGKVHKCFGELSFMLASPPHNLTEFDWTEPPLAMPDEYKTDDVVESYRNYYNGAKSGMFKWTNRETPTWANL